MVDGSLFGLSVIATEGKVFTPAGPLEIEYAHPFEYERVSALAFVVNVSNYGWRLLFTLI